MFRVYSTDEVEEVEISCRHLISEIEGIVGESIQEYLSTAWAIKWPKWHWMTLNNIINVFITNQCSFGLFFQLNSESDCYWYVSVFVYVFVFNNV